MQDRRTDLIIVIPEADFHVLGAIQPDHVSHAVEVGPKWFLATIVAFRSLYPLVTVLDCVIWVHVQEHVCVFFQDGLEDHELHCVLLLIL